MKSLLCLSRFMILAFAAANRNHQRNVCCAYLINYPVNPNYKQSSLFNLRQEVAWKSSQAENEGLALYMIFENIVKEEELRNLAKNEGLM